jgi:RHS repeat-associated protein
VKYYHQDAIGNVRVVTDANGNVLERHDYLPFGEECTTGLCSNNPGAGAGQPRKFTGKERDAETGFDYFGARYYGSKIGRFTTVDPVYTWRENLVDPQRWNRYSYVRNNPLKYVDPDGRAIVIFVDAGFIGYDVSDLVATYRSGESPTATQWLALGGDVVGAAIPFATGFGMAIRAESKAEHAVEAGRAAEHLIEANRARGVESEARVLKQLGEAKNTGKVHGCEGCSIPDYQNATTIGEIKDAARVDNTRQLRIQRDAAVASGRQHVVQAGTNAKVSRKVEEAGTVVKRREDLGPRQ